MSSPFRFWTVCALAGFATQAHAAKVVKVTRDKNRVVLKLDAGELANVRDGVTITLPDGSEMRGTVAQVKNGQAVVAMDGDVAHVRKGQKVGVAKAMAAKSAKPAAPAEATTAPASVAEAAEPVASRAEGSHASPSFVENVMDIDETAADQLRYTANRALDARVSYAQGRVTLKARNGKLTVKADPLAFGLGFAAYITPDVKLQAIIARSETTTKIELPIGSGKTKSETQVMAIRAAYRMKPNLGLGLEMQNVNEHEKDDTGSGSTSHNVVIPSVLYVMGVHEFGLYWQAPYAIREQDVSLTDPGAIALRYTYQMSASQHLLTRLARVFHSALDAKNDTDSTQLSLGMRFLPSEAAHYTALVTYETGYANGSSKQNAFNDDSLSLALSYQRNFAKEQLLGVDLGYAMANGKRDGVKWDRNQLSVGLSYSHPL